MSFRFKSLFRRGSWIAFRKFILEEHRDINRRIREIEKQIELIGDIIVFYHKDEDGEVTQKRKGVYVTENSSLHKLCVAYILQGGNILDISMFLKPQQSSVSETSEGNEIKDNYPMNGLISPLSGSPGQEVFTGGFVGLDKHYFWKIGRAEIPDDAKRKVETTIDILRIGFEKEIKTKRNRLEEKIIKLCDLREQLSQEKDLLLVLQGDTEEIKFTTHYNINFFDKVLWLADEDNNYNADPEKPNTFDISLLNNEDEDIQQNENLALRTFFVNVFEDSASDVYPTTSL